MSNDRKRTVELTDGETYSVLYLIGRYLEDPEDQRELKPLTKKWLAQVQEKLKEVYP